MLTHSSRILHSESRVEVRQLQRTVPQWSVCYDVRFLVAKLAFCTRTLYVALHSTLSAASSQASMAHNDTRIGGTTRTRRKNGNDLIPYIVPRT